MRLLRPLSQSEVESDDLYREAVTFMNDFKPLEGRSYDWVYEHAIRTFDRANEGIDYLDKKAESMVRYLGPGSGLLGVLFTRYVTPEVHQEWVTMVPAVVGAAGVLCIIAAIFAALRVVVPYPHTYGASVQDATKVAEEFGDRDKCLGYYATGLAVSIAILRIVSKKKAQQLSWCHGLFLAGITAFLAAGVWAILS